jgi:hypothetical protein
MVLRPESWPETIRFLCDEQDRLERLRPIRGGLLANSEEIDVLCLQYAATHNWPATISARDRNAILARFVWARAFCASLLNTFRKADGTEIGKMPYPDWDFEPMMIFLMVDSWSLRKSIQKGDSNPPLLPPPPPGSDAT